MSTCINHPLKTASGRCKTCNAPLCNQCKIVTDAGIFCSDECEEKARHFMAKVADVPAAKQKTRFFTRRTAKSLVILAAVFFGAVLFFYQFMGIRSVDDFKDFWATIWEARRLLIP